jgi:predicted kinase
MSPEPPVLVVIGGLPATGKSTIAERLARLVRAPYLRVDRIEQAVVAYSPLEHPIGAAGYAVAHALAGEQLGLGLDVIVECVNPLAVTRDGWAATAAGAGAAILDVEVICSDLAEHQRRAEERTSDVEGLVKPTWQEIRNREYDPWSRPRLVVDSAEAPPDEAVRSIAQAITAARSDLRSLMRGLPSTEPSDASIGANS